MGTRRGGREECRVSRKGIDNLKDGGRKGGRGKGEGEGM